MKITETQVTEAQWEEVSRLVIQEDAYMDVGSTDVRNILIGKAGAMYQGKEGYMLISIGNIETDPMNMTDICAINEFFEELSPEIEAMWSVFRNKAEDGLTITAICTNKV